MTVHEPNNPGPAIDLIGVTKQYVGSAEPAVENFSLHIPAGELVVFVGPSGCGKTTTMRMINRLIEPTNGQILIGGTDVATADPAALRRTIGYVIQHSGLFPHLSVARNVATVPKLLRWPKGRINARVEELLTLVGLAPSEYANRYPHQLSGGQQQRVGVARALAADPGVLLMDEPFGATDPVTRLRLQREFRRLQTELGKTVVFVTHDFEEALLLGDRIAVLTDRSRLVQYDTPLGLLNAPADEHVRAFVGESAHVRMLGLISVNEVALRAGVGTSLVTVDRQATLREVTDRLVGGADSVQVCGDRGELLGHLTFDDVRQHVQGRTAELQR